MVFVNFSFLNNNNLEKFGYIFLTDIFLCSSLFISALFLLQSLIIG